jgi:glycosyltransferase involved in cell wall biosynthesis
LAGDRQVGDIYPVALKKNEFSVLRVSPKISMVNTTVLIPESVDIISEVSRKLLMLRLRALVKELGFEDAILWILNPRIIDIAKGLPARIKVFDTIDNLLAHPQTQKYYHKIKSAYEWAESNVDLICIISEKQKVMYSSSQKLFLLANGVDDNYANAPQSMPEDIRGIAKPIVMYVGVLQEKIDVDLMIKVARLLPGHQFVFIGPEVAQNYFDGMKRERNIDFIGVRDCSAIPSYINSCDVCIIPHKVDELTNYMDPLKIYEYLACGKPIVSTPIAGTGAFGRHIYIAGGPAQFAQAIQKALSENSPALEGERRALASLNTWNVRINAVLDKIDEELNVKGNQVL